MHFIVTQIQILYLYYKMISRLLRIQSHFLNHSGSAAFCINKKYFQNKRKLQIQKEKNSFTADQSKLKEVCLNMKQLSPNFFARTLPIKLYQKIKMADRKANAIQNSYIRLQIPVKHDKQIRNTLIRLKSNEVRIGRLLECMDSIAGIVGYTHGFGNLQRANPFVLVTACVQSINLFEPITIEDDIIMQGYVNHVGKTSMEIQIGLLQSNSLKAHALFTMASRDATDLTKSYPCPQLQISHLKQPELSKAKIRDAEAKARVLGRKKQLAQSYKIKPPVLQDIQILHDMFVNYKKLRDNQVDIEQTVMTNTHLMHVQQRNVHGKIFGGFLMREMIESGWITACQFALDQKLQIQDLTDVYFHQPVEIGCHLKIRGRVSYTHGNIVVVTMEAYTHHISQKPTEKLCCFMHMFLKCPKEQKKVYPRSYENGIYYLTSKNAFNHLFMQN